MKEIGQEYIDRIYIQKTPFNGYEYALAVQQQEMQFQVKRAEEIIVTATGVNEDNSLGTNKFNQ